MLARWLTAILPDKTLAEALETDLPPYNASS
jgi:hypothetical protein